MVLEEENNFCFIISWILYSVALNIIKGFIILRPVLFYEKSHIKMLSYFVGSLYF